MGKLADTPSSHQCLLQFQIYQHDAQNVYIHSPILPQFTKRMYLDVILANFHKPLYNWHIC